MVQNAGAYKVATWWWFHDVTGAQLDASLTADNARLVYVDAYQTSSGELFAAVAVLNTGADARSWWWYRDTSGSAIQSQLNAHNARLAEVKSYLIGTTEFQLAIMVLQAGIDAKNWSWGLSLDTATIQNELNNWHYRLLSLERNPFGGYDVVLVQSEGEKWWWDADQSFAQITSNLTSRKARLTDITPYLSGSSTLYAVVMMDDTNLETKAINAETTRVMKVLAKGLGKGEYGLYLGQVGGSAILGQNQTFRYEPASAIKVLYLLYSMVQVQAGLDSLSSDVVYYPDPNDPNNPGVCPDPVWETSGNARHTTLQQALTAMMQVSDNRMTRALALRYGITNVDAYAHQIGMSNTHLLQDRIGCLFVNGVRNELTSIDIGSLYAQVDNGSLLTPANVSTFYSIMLGGAVPSNSALATVVQQEAAKQRKSTSAPAFIAAMSYHEKAGNEFMCVSVNCSTNPQYLDFTSVSGTINLPFKSAGTIVPTYFVYSRFGNDFVLPCLPGSGSCSADRAAQNAVSTLQAGGAETYRQEIAVALTTW
jgi:hypothetical protein